MASSVSSERAFSSAGITISKRRNLLKADIVEALQFLKCAFQKDLIFREPEPSSTTEEAEGDLPELEKDLASWDTLADLGEDENDSDIDNVMII
jgi:hAT family C-terminal dimerisation region